MYPESLPLYNEHPIWYDEDNITYESKRKRVAAFLHTKYNFNMHCHEFFEINIVTSGDGCHYIGDKIHMEIHSGDIFVIPPMLLHGYYTEGTLDVFHILVRNDLINDYRSELAEIPGFNALFEIEPTLRQGGKAFFLRLKKYELMHIIPMLNELERYTHTDMFLLQDVSTIKLICELCIMMNSAIQSKNDKDDSAIMRILTYIHANYQEKITVKALSDMFYVSPSTLNRHFKRICGCSPIEYLVRYRVRCAVNLMKEGKQSKSDIAQTCGFYDVSHLYKCMKQLESTQ